MRMQTNHSPFAIGAIIGVIFTILMRFMIFRILFFVGVCYAVCVPLYDYFFTKSYADPSQYSFRLDDEQVPDTSFTNSTLTYHLAVQMTNHHPSLKIYNWTLWGTLYDCPRAFVPIDMCRKVHSQGKWINDPVLPGETRTTTTVVDFTNTRDVTGLPRVVWEARTVVLDSDTDLDQYKRESDAALDEYYSSRSWYKH